MVITELYITCVRSYVTYWHILVVHVPGMLNYHQKDNSGILINFQSTKFLGQRITIVGYLYALSLSIIVVSLTSALLIRTNNHFIYHRNSILMVSKSSISTPDRKASGYQKIRVFADDLEAQVYPQNPWVDLEVPPVELRPSATLTNGQCFNWIPVERVSNETKVPHVQSPSKISAWGVHDALEWIGVINQTVFSIRETPHTTLYRVLSGNMYDTESIGASLRDYFQLNIPLEPLYLEWSEQDKKRMARIAKRIKGCRILRQAPIECLFSFICSSNNNIPRITQILNRFREQYGKKIVEIPVVVENNEKCLHTMYSFPELIDFQVASEDDLRLMGLGYRAKYIIKTRDLLIDFGGESWLLDLRGKDEDFVQNELIKLHGIGRKVADCVALFSLDQTRAIPVDVHVQHIACRDYDATILSNLTKSLTPKVYQEVAGIFKQRFPLYPGWAHSLLFVAELPSFRPVLPPDMIEEMDEWKLVMQQKKQAIKRDKKSQEKGQVKSETAIKKRKT